MARNRQRSKQRQAERRARRLEQQGGDGQQREGGAAVPGVTPEPVELEAEEHLAEEEAYEQIEDWEHAEDFAEDDLIDDGAATGAGEAGYAVRGRRGRDPSQAHKDRPRVVQFLIAVWAELQRVQWPDRQTMITL